MSQTIKVIVPADMGQTITFGETESNKWNVKVDSDDLQVKPDGSLALAEDREKHVTAAALKDSELVLELSDGTELTADLAGLIPPAKADIFLSAITYDSITKELVLTVKNGTSEGVDKEIRVSVADLIPVSVESGTGLKGDGTASSPIAFDKPNMTKLVNSAGDVTVGYIVA